VRFVNVPPFLRSSRARLGLALLLVAALGVSTFRHTVGLGLIGSDTYLLIAASGVESTDDAVAKLTQPLMGGRNIAVRFYRPASQGLFLVERALYGTNPLGYHLTGVAIHVLCAILLVLLARIWTGSLAAAALAGALLAIHPTSLEAVPFPARVQDMLATMFGLGALLAHESVLRRPSWARWLAASVLAALAFLSKETGLLFSGLLLMSHALRGQGTPAGRVLRAGGALALALVPALALRFSGLTEAGGYGSEFLQRPVEFASRFLRLLLDPAQRFGSSTADWAALVAFAGLWVCVPLRIALLLVAWIAALLGAYLVLGFIHSRPIPLSAWYLYPALPAATISVSAVIVGAFRTGRRWVAAPALAGAVIAASELASSPLLVRYPELETGDRLARSYFETLDHLLRARDPRTEVLRPGPMPVYIARARGFPSDSMFVWPGTVRAWLELFHPDVRAHVVDPRKPEIPPAGAVRIESGMDWLRIDDSGEIVEERDVMQMYRELEAQFYREEGRAPPSPPPALDPRFGPLEEAVRERPDDVEAWLALGLNRRLHGHLARAKVALEQVVALRPDDWEARYELAQVYARRGALRKASEQLDSVLELNPGYLPAEHSREIVRGRLARERARGVSRSVPRSSP
jgi:hypothetical protein